MATRGPRGRQSALVHPYYRNPVHSNQPQNLNFFVTEPFVLNDAEITILEKSAKAKQNAVQEEDTDDSNNGPFFLTVNASHFQITFWIGFNSS